MLSAPACWAASWAWSSVLWCFPLIIWYAYQMIFSMSTFTLHFYPGMAAASVAISAAVIGFATWNACRASLKEKTAALLLPRAPVAGKRIFLEYITPLWQHMSFSQKTTARNLFRYKKRFFMTVLGAWQAARRCC